MFSSTNGTSLTVCDVPSGASSTGIAAGSAILYIAGMDLTTINGSKFAPKLSNKAYPTTVMFFGNGYFVGWGVGYINDAARVFV